MKLITKHISQFPVEPTYGFGRINRTLHYHQIMEYRNFGIMSVYALVIFTIKQYPILNIITKDIC